MSEEAVEKDSGLGKLIKSTKKLAAIRQIEASIAHFWVDEYECAITLAAAAEGLLPPTAEPHIFTILKASPLFEEMDFNLFINWLKHPTKTDEATIPEFEVAIIIARAISKFAAVYNEGSDEMRHFTHWVFKVGHLTLPDGWPKNGKAT